MRQHHSTTAVPLELQSIERLSVVFVQSLFARHGQPRNPEVVGKKGGQGKRELTSSHVGRGGRREADVPFRHVGVQQREVGLPEVTDDLAA